jgi:predicted DNA-binding ribbon-helix-helix protein
VFVLLAITLLMTTLGGVVNQLTLKHLPSALRLQICAGLVEKQSTNVTAVWSMPAAERQAPSR